VSPQYKKLEILQKREFSVVLQDRSNVANMIAISVGLQLILKGPLADCAARAAAAAVAKV
jgi:hypothetical protein